jgi:hypothetical protein
VPGTEASRPTRIALLVVAAGALALRVAPLVRAGGPLAWVVDYDESVYFAASALLFKGVLPYRDFVFVHPPGVVYFAGLVSWIADPARGFAAVRILAAVTGAVTTYLAGRVALRAAGPAAAVAAAALYATYPDAVGAERGAFLEMVLNVTCLGMAYVWLRRRDEASTKTPFAAGLLCGCACAVKVFGGMWFLAALASAPKGRFRRDVPPFIGGGLLAGLVLLAPLALRAPHAFIEDTLLFHAWRPPDGIVSRATRVPEILGGGHVVATFLAIVALLLIVPNTARGRVTSEERFFSVAMLLTVVLFFASSSYWNQYNAHLAASECVLAGIGAGALLRRVNRPAAMAIALLLAIPSLRVSLLASRAGGPSLTSYGAAIREIVPRDASLFTLEPQWAMAAGHLPPHDRKAPVIVDSYGAMLLDAVRGGVKFPDTGAAFQSPRAQTAVLARISASRFLILGWRGDWQLNAQSREAVMSNFACDMPSAGQLCLYERADESRLGLTAAPAGLFLAFGDGWYAMEGPPTHRWRWMGARSTTTLPAIRGRARLELRFEIPHEVVPAMVTVSLDGRVLDRIALTSTSGAGGYDVDGSGPHLLTLETSRTISPAKLGISGDTRELGLRLDRIVWLRAR